MCVKGGASTAYRALQKLRVTSAVIRSDADGAGVGLKITQELQWLGQALESKGYTVVVMLIDSKTFAIPQRRLRLWVVGTQDPTRRRPEAFARECYTDDLNDLSVPDLIDIHSQRMA